MENDEYVRYNVIVIVRLPVLCRLFFCASCMASCLRKKGQASFVIGSFRPLDFGGAIISQPEDAFCIDISQSECYIVNNQLTKRLKTMKGGFSLLEVSGLSFHYQSHVPVLTDLTFSVSDGEIIGLLGKNGVGKTTTLKLILGLLPLEKGSICLGNYSLYRHPMQYRKQINYVSDSHDIYNNLTGKEYLNFIADMYEVPSETRGKIYTPLIEAFQVEKYLNSPIKKLSHGTKQKIAIIASLVNDPLLWVLDEPMMGLDVEAVQVLKELIKSRAACGKSVLFSSHILEICENLCDKIVIMQAGTIKKTIELRGNSSYILEDIYLEVVNDVPME